ncbi:potassium channel modulatory factor 1 [Brevipalpus obovatus]|uniref:potassium channel modulatory factor 1 n=1 Tax=Brevipalpus obovatus TaxID=246614 RepID=UPI003D9EBC17
MSNHEGVSCDSCLKGDFRGKRYKCLTCLNYDLCSTCYESGASSTRHTSDHPMQCILTRSDYEIFYGGETTINTDQPYSFTCPFCGRMGFTETTLQEHAASEHSDATQQVICPICSSSLDSEPNHVTDDFTTHLALEHRNLREWDEPPTAMRGRRAPHPTRGMTSSRPRRSPMQFTSTAGLSSFTSANRESMDPIAEILSQLSGVRRAPNLGHSNQIQQLQMQLQLDRSSNGPPRQVSSRAPVDRLMSRRHQQNSNSGQSQLTPKSYKSSVNGNGPQPLSYPYLSTWDPAGSSSIAPSSSGVNNQPTISPITALNGSNASVATNQSLATTCAQPQLSEAEQEALELERAVRSLFVQELLLNTLIVDKLETKHNQESESSVFTIKNFLSQRQ